MSGNFKNDDQEQNIILVLTSHHLSRNCYDSILLLLFGQDEKTGDEVTIG